MTSGPAITGLHGLSAGSRGKSAGRPEPDDVTADATLTSAGGFAASPPSLLHIAAVITMTAPTAPAIRRREFVMIRVLDWGCSASVVSSFVDGSVPGKSGERVSRLST